jgi:hypothetical protein
MHRTACLGCALAVTVAIGACGGGGGDDCGDDCEVTTTSYRMTAVELRDPHLFAFTAIDVTDMVNTSLADALVGDGDDDTPPDGELDLSIVLRLRPARPSSASTDLEVVLEAACAPPAATTTCAAGADSTVIPTTATHRDSTCLEPVAGTTGGYAPVVTTPAGRCFVSGAEDVAIDASGVVLALIDARVAATYGSGDPPGTLVDGLFAGFMTEDAADATILPESLPFVGGEPLSSLLLARDADTGPRGEAGWWFYFNFTAEVVPFTE